MSTKKNETQKKLPAIVCAQHDRAAEEVKCFTDAETTVRILREKGVDVDSVSEAMIANSFRFCLPKGEVDAATLEFLSNHGNTDWNKFDNLNEETMIVLLMTCFRYVVSIAADYLGRDMCLLELIQAGYSGLLDAVESYYRSSREYKFTEYVVLYIRHYVIDQITEEVFDPICVPFSDVLDAVRSTSEKLRETLGREATPEEVAERTGYPCDSVETVFTYLRRSERYREILSGECMMDFDPADYD